MKFESDTACVLLFLTVISLIGGVVNYCLRRGLYKKENKGLFFLSQLLISAFTGFLGGLLSIENGASITMTMFISGVCGTTGSTLLLELKKRVMLIIKGGL